MGQGHTGTYVITWQQVRTIGGGGRIDAITEGMVLHWSGRAVRLDGPPSVLLLTDPVCIGEGDASGAGGGGADPAETEDLVPENSILVTDGDALYTLILIETGSVIGPLILFEDGLPPEDTPLTVLRARGGEAPVTRHGGVDGHMICFTRGTYIRTPEGPRPVEDLAEGDLVSTKDDGPREIRWIGTRDITGARMFAMPELRPVRIRAGALGDGLPERDLWVSPDHRMLYSGPNARALYNTPEVLVTARALINDRSITVDHALRETTYVHLLFDRQQILWANGAETESFHPGQAALEMMDLSQRARLMALCPGLDEDRMAYGAYARRVLSRPETEILLYESSGGH